MCSTASRSNHSASPIVLGTRVQALTHSIEDGKYYKAGDQGLCLGPSHHGSDYVDVQFDGGMRCSPTQSSLQVLSHIQKGMRVIAVVNSVEDGTYYKAGDQGLCLGPSPHGSDYVEVKFDGGMRCSPTQSSLQVLSHDIQKGMRVIAVVNSVEDGKYYKAGDQGLCLGPSPHGSNHVEVQFDGGMLCAPTQSSLQVLSQDIQKGMRVIAVVNSVEDGKYYKAGDQGLCWGPSLLGSNFVYVQFDGGMICSPAKYAVQVHSQEIQKLFQVLPAKADVYYTTFVGSQGLTNNCIMLGAIHNAHWKRAIDHAEKRGHAIAAIYEETWNGDMYKAGMVFAGNVLKFGTGRRCIVVHGPGGTGDLGNTQKKELEQLNYHKIPYELLSIEEYEKL